MKRRPVPGPDEDINIYDLAIMDDVSVRARVEKTLAQHPSLRRLYSPQFLDSLVPDRQNLDNHLLLLLADTVDSFATGFWTDISNDLAVLEDVRAFEVFTPKLRQRDRIGIQSAKTELELAAWMRRKGHPIELEPLNPETGRRCEFAAESAPPTSWEVKSVLDQGTIREQEKIRTEVAKRLRYIDDPYLLNVDIQGLRLQDVHEAVSSVLERIRKFHRGGAQPIPISFESHGLQATIVGRSQRPYGYSGTEIIGPYWLGDEDIRRVLDRVRDAVSQMRRGRAGIAVIDTSMADFVEREDVEGACYGELSEVVVGGKLLDVRGREAVFRPDRNNRISAVVHYERRRPGDVTMSAYHNPFADTQLPYGILADRHVKQVRRVQVSDITYCLEELPPG